MKKSYEAIRKLKYERRLGAWERKRERLRKTVENLNSNAGSTSMKVEGSDPGASAGNPNSDLTKQTK